MDFRQLKYFVRIVELGSLTRAAEALRISQPALGLQVRNLEIELRTQLLERRSRGIVPTSAGVLLAERAKRILGEVDDAKRAIHEHAGNASGEVTIGITPSTNAALAARLIQRSADEHPAIQLRIIEGLTAALIEMVRAGRADFAVVYYLEAPPPGFIAEPIAREELMFIESGQTDGRPSAIAFQEVCQFPLVVPGQPHGLRVAIDRHAAERGLTLNVQFEMQSIAVILELVQQGLGCGILPYGAAASKISSGQVRATRIVDPTIERTMSIISREHSKPPKAEHVVKAMLTDEAAAWKRDYIETSERQVAGRRASKR